jgi:hypothetical protein
MKFASTLVSLFLGAVTVSALGTSTAGYVRDPLGLHGDDLTAAVAAPVAKPLTNGQRLANGLPPMKPRHFYDSKVVKRQAASPVT